MKVATKGKYTGLNIAQIEVAFAERKIRKHEELVASVGAEKAQQLEELLALGLGEGEKEVYGICAGCGRGGKYIDDGDDEDWLCLRCCSIGGFNDSDTSDDESDDTEVYGVCDECGKEGKFFGKEGDDWTCERCSLLWDLDDSDEEDEEELDVDDRDAPNIYPYKKCSDCGERKSCGNYKYNDWFCEDC
jgi:hypothetical protein